MSRKEFSTFCIYFIYIIMQQRIRCDTTKDVPRDPHQLLLSELARQDREEASRVDIIAGRSIDQRLGASDQYIILDSSRLFTSLFLIK